jgi:cell division septation protein DedD
MAQDFVKKKTTSQSRKATSKPAQQRKSSGSRATKKPVKRKTNARRPITTKSPPFWAWVAIAASLIGFGIFLSQLSGPADDSAIILGSNEDSKSLNKESNNSASIKKESQIKFDFYEILKGKEVNVDDRIVEKTPEQKNITYYLQAGSFKQLGDADTLRAKLLLQGLSVSTEGTTGKNGQEWHRVVVGPFNTRSKLAKARSILASNNINSIVLKR